MRRQRYIPIGRLPTTPAEGIARMLEPLGLAPARCSLASIFL
jgi:hypothetical protein